MRASLPFLVSLPMLAAAQAPSEPLPFVLELTVEVGKVRVVTTGPVRNVVCDHADVVELAWTGDGNGFRGLAPGETSCSFVTADGVRRTVHAVVTAAKKP